MRENEPQITQPEDQQAIETTGKRSRGRAPPPPPPDAAWHLERTSTYVISRSAEWRVTRSSSRDGQSDGR